LTVPWHNGPANTSPTCQDLLADPGSTVASVVSQASAFGLPGIINETTTYYGQGMPGVSDCVIAAAAHQIDRDALASLAERHHRENTDQ
jgi:hypothetical protein